LKFGSHIGKGAWAISSRGLTALYGVVSVAVMAVIPKSEFGTLSLFQAVFSMLFTFSDNFAFQAIVKFGVEPDVDIRELISTTSALFLGFATLVVTLAFILSSPIAIFLKDPHIPSLLPSLALMILVTGPRVVASKLLQMRFRMRELFIVDASNMGLSSAALVILLSTGWINRAQDVIYVTIACGAVSSLVGIWLARAELHWKPKFSRTTYERILHFVQYQSGIGVVSVLQSQIDTPLVSAFTGPIGVATYAGAKLFYRGFEMIRDTAVMFIFPATSKYHSRGDIATLRKIMEKSVGFLYLLLIPVGVLLVFGAPLLYHTIYHTKYDASIPIFQVLCLATLVLPLQITFMPSLIGIGKLREAFRFTLTAFIVNIVLMVGLMLLFHNIIGAAIAFVAGTACQGILAYRFVKEEVGFESKGLLRRSFADALGFVQTKLKRAS
jgi:O-antigen/teichoic acid export membrane protein